MMSPDMPPPNQLGPNTRFTIGDFDVSVQRSSSHLFFIQYFDRDLMNLTLSLIFEANFEKYEKLSFSNGDVWLIL